MNNKSQISSMLDLWTSRSKKTLKEVAYTVYLRVFGVDKKSLAFEYDLYGDLALNAFQPPSSAENYYKNFIKRFRENETRDTRFRVWEVTEVIRCFRQDLTLHESCSAFEALLFCEWTGSSLLPLLSLKDLFTELAIEIALIIYIREGCNRRFDYFSPSTIRQTLLQIRQELDARLPKNRGFNKEYLRPPDMQKTNFDEDNLSEVLNTVKRMIWGGETDNCLKVLNEIAYQIELAQDSKLHARYHELSGIVFTNQAKFDYAERELDIAHSLDPENPSIIANQGGNEYFRGNYLSAVRYLENCFELAHQQGRTDVMVYAQTTLGNVFAESDRSQAMRAHDHYQRARKIANGNNLEERVAFIDMNIGILHAYQEKYDEALILFHGALENVSLETNKHLYLHLAWQRVRVMMRTKAKYASLKRELQDLIQECSNLKAYDWIQLGIRIDLGKLLLLLHDNESSLQCFAQVAQDAISTQHQKYALLGCYGVACAISQSQLGEITPIQLVKAVQDAGLRELFKRCAGLIDPVSAKQLSPKYNLAYEFSLLTDNPSNSSGSANVMEAIYILLP